MDVGAKTHLSGVEAAASLLWVTSHPVRPGASDGDSPRAGGATSPQTRRVTSPSGGDPQAPGDPGGKLVAPLTPGRATPGYRGPQPDQVPGADDPRPRVWVDQQLCTGDGFCAKLAPEQFRMHWDGLAYVVGPDGEMRTGPGQSVPVLPDQVRPILAATVKCPGDCIYVLPGADGTVYGLPSPRQGPSPGA